MTVMYLDESGDHSLHTIDPQYPVFVLGGVIVDGVDARRVIDRQLSALKKSFFGRDDLILHTSDIVRARHGFESLTDPRKRAAFYGALNKTMHDLDYKVIACIIRKDAHLALYKSNAIDPYTLSLRVLVERFCQEIGGAKEGGMICAERRGPELDLALESTWMNILRRGTTFKRGGDISNRIVDLTLKDKRLNIGGLQLADLVIAPIARSALAKPTREDWEIVRGKLRQGPSGYEGFGLVELPKKA